MHRLSCITALLAALTFLTVASATAQEQPVFTTHVVRNITIAPSDSVVLCNPGQGERGSSGWRWCWKWNPCLRGGAIGLLVGAGVGTVVFLAGGDGPMCQVIPCFSEPTSGEKAAVGAVMGGLLGAVAGYVAASIHEHDRLSVRLAPQRDGRFALGMRIAF